MTETPLGLKEAAALRERAEAAILQILNELSDYTGLDLAAVQVYLIAAVPRGGDDPQRRAEAVRIDLCV